MTLNLVPPSQNLIAKDGILLEAAGVPLGGGGSLYVPVGEPQFTDGSEEAAAGEELPAEYAGEQPAGTLER